MALDTLGQGRTYPFEVQVHGYCIDGNFFADWGRLTGVLLGDNTYIGVDVLGYRADELVTDDLRGFANMVIKEVGRLYRDEIEGTRPKVRADSAPIYR